MRDIMYVGGLAFIFFLASVWGSVIFFGESLFFAFPILMLSSVLLLKSCLATSEKESDKFYRYGKKSMYVTLFVYFGIASFVVGIIAVAFWAFCVFALRMTFWVIETIGLVQDDDF